MSVDWVDHDDVAMSDVVDALRTADPTGSRSAQVFRDTFDQLYDGQRTGRYRWDQLFKTEKTHYGTLIEINLRREFDGVITDGDILDYSICTHEVDCKYSQKLGAWMLPPESFGQLILCCTADDQAGTWNMGIVRVTEGNRRTSTNRDGKTSLSAVGRSDIVWLHRDAVLPPNVLLQVPPEVTATILEPKSGQQRVNKLFRLVTNRRIGRNTVATVAQQDDYMKRVRANGGARTTLRPEGYLILGGDYSIQRDIAVQLGTEVPEPGEFVSVRVKPVDHSNQQSAVIDGRTWTLANAVDVIEVPAPMLPQR